jgi:hypothetical protein
LEAGTAGKCFNTTVVFGPDGAELARYRKIHLFDITTPSGKVFRESDHFGRGREIVTAPVLGTTLGLSICYDLRFPELYQALAARGAEILAVPSAFTVETGRDHWEPLLRARAIETASWVIAATQWGPHGESGRTSYGHAVVVDPWGHVVARKPDGEGWLTAHLDLALGQAVLETGHDTAAGPGTELNHVLQLPVGVVPGVGAAIERRWWPGSIRIALVPVVGTLALRPVAGGAVLRVEVLAALQCRRVIDSFESGGAGWTAVHSIAACEDRHGQYQVRELQSDRAPHRSMCHSPRLSSGAFSGGGPSLLKASRTEPQALRDPSRSPSQARAAPSRIPSQALEERSPISEDHLASRSRSSLRAS